MKHSMFTLAMIFIMGSTVHGQWDILNEGGDFSTIDFANDSIGWIVGGGNILKTEDVGNTWNKISLNDNIYIAELDFINESIGWAISDTNFILKSLDGGNSWIIQEEFTNTEMLKLQVVNDSTVYISGISNDYPKFFKTIDGGDNWTTITRYENDRKYHSIWFQDSENGMFIGTEYYNGTPVKSIILRTNDGGSTFTETIILTFDWMKEFQIINDSTAYFIGGRYPSILCVTNDTLNSWTQLANINYSFYSLDDTTIFAVVDEDTVYSLKKSTDGGATWEQIRSLYWFSVGLGFAMECNIYFINEDVGFIVGGELTDYILQTIDGGNEWQIQKFDLSLKDICFIDRYKGFAGGGGGPGRTQMGCAWGSMFVSDDGGQSWFKKGPGGKVFKVDFVDPLIGYTLSLHGGGWWYETRIHKTIDGGNSWDFISDYSFARDIVFRDSQLGWIVGRGGYENDTTFIIQTTDGGNNWEYVWENTVYDGLNSIYDVEGTLWAVGDSGLILTSVGPDSFEVVSNVTDLPLNDIFFSDAQHGWIIGGNSSLLKTINSGQTWIEKQFDEYFIFDVYFADSLYGWVVGSDTSFYSTGAPALKSGNGVILNTIDGGENWTAQVEDLSARINTIHFKDGYGWAAGGNGLILKTDDGATWIDQKTGKTYPNKFTLKQNYPNPFNPVTSIEYQVARISHVELSIYNILGQKVVKLVSEKQTAGTYKVEWDAAGFASGIYFYRLETDKGFVQSKKLILLK